jgi:hypothetical protein
MNTEQRRSHVSAALRTRVGTTAVPRSVRSSVCEPDRSWVPAVSVKLANKMLSDLTFVDDATRWKSLGYFAGREIEIYRTDSCASVYPAHWRPRHGHTSCSEIAQDVTELRVVHELGLGASRRTQIHHRLTFSAKLYRTSRWLCRAMGLVQIGNVRQSSTQRA